MAFSRICGCCRDDGSSSRGGGDGDNDGNDGGGNDDDGTGRRCCRADEDRRRLLFQHRRSRIAAILCFAGNLALFALGLAFLLSTSSSSPPSNTLALQQQYQMRIVVGGLLLSQALASTLFLLLLPVCGVSKTSARTRTQLGQRQRHRLRSRDDDDDSSSSASILLFLVRSACLCQVLTGITLMASDAVIISLPKVVSSSSSSFRLSSASLAIGTVVFFAAGLALMISFWPVSTSDDEDDDDCYTAVRDPPVANSGRRNVDQVATENDEQRQEQQHHQSLLEPLLPSLPENYDEGDNDESEGAQSREGEEQDVETTGGERRQSGDDEDIPTSRFRGTRRLLHLASSQVVYLYSGCAVLLLRLPFSLAIPHLVSTTLSLLHASRYEQAVHQIFYLVLAGTIDAALDFWCILLFGLANQRIVKNLRIDLFGRIIRQEVAFFDQNTSGELASRIQSDW